MNRHFSTAALAVGIAAALAFGAAAQGKEPVAQEDVALLKRTGKAFAEVARKAIPAVVFVEVEQTVQAQGYGRPDSPYDFFGDEFFRQFFGAPSVPRQFRQRGQGSGFIITKDGYILTNNHIVGDADKITVKLRDGRSFEARLIGADPKTDVAVVKIEGKNLPVLEPGNSEELEIGEWVVAVGNPFGLTETVTVGVVSAKGRSNIGMAEYEDFIQTDAAINPGNSGGPLLNIEGKVIGMNTFIVTRSGGYMGIGFAIPINMAVSIKDQLVKSGKVVRGQIGIVIGEMTTDLARQFGLDEPRGILIQQVMENSPAEKAGLKHGDVIVELDGKPVESVGAFRNTVASNPPGTAFKLSVFRDGKARTVEVTTAALGEEAAGVEGADAVFEALGMRLENLTDEMAERFGYKKGDGVIVAQVENGGQAAQLGIRPGHLVTSVGQRDVKSVEEFVDAVNKTKRDGRILLRIVGERYAHYVTMSVE
ncbi:MAG: DegQ family serine endoprotease [Lentisphaerae bacterium]|nr:DegQ family serine endoprotease [Lentisphaerota bacterium]